MSVVNIVCKWLFFGTLVNGCLIYGSVEFHSYPQVSRQLTLTKHEILISLFSYWKNYFEKTDGIIWVVDAADQRRLHDCKQELDQLIAEEVRL